MIVLLSPAKTLDFASPSPIADNTKPVFHTHANRLAAAGQKLKPREIGRLMSVSDALAERTAEYFGAWKKKYDCQGAKQAAFAYQGDVYTGLQANALTKRDLAFAQDNLRILSGLYGLLRPLDLIQPYRLEMGTKLATDDAPDLYAYWQDRVTRALAKTLAGHKEQVVVNLASTEYFKAVDTKRLGCRVISATFKEAKDGKLRFLTMFGKQARGLMARYVIRNRLARAADLLGFDDGGYRLDHALSSEDSLVFTRKQPAAKAQSR